jgi:hypothetical protein
MARGRRLAIAGLLTVGLLVPAGAASAKDGDVIREGRCSGASDWKLKLSEENNRIEVEYEVDSNVNGQTWRVRLFRNGNRFFLGTRVTQGPSGSFEVRRVIDNLAGDDVVTARARNLGNGEICRGRAVWTA